MEKITFNQITKTYNGKSGCACGCNGTYTIPSHVAIEDANKAVGYNAYNADSVSDRRCKIALTKINKAIEEYGPLAKLDARGGYEHFGVNEDSNRVWFYYSDKFVAIEINGRSSTVYLD
jgi:hypothetical protein